MSTENNGNDGFTDDVLLAAGVYDTEAMGSRGTSRIKGTVWADQAGTLTVYQGPTAAKCDDIVTTIAVAACVNPGDGEGFTIDCIGRFFKIVYTNGGVDQTEFRLGWKIGTLTF